MMTHTFRLAETTELETNSCYLLDDLYFNERRAVKQEKIYYQSLKMVHQLAANYEVLLEWAAGVDLLQNWLQIDPYDEEAHYQLMRFLIEDGQYEAALAQYAACRRILSAAMGIEPDERMKNLARELMTEIPILR